MSLFKRLVLNFALNRKGSIANLPLTDRNVSSPNSLSAWLCLFLDDRGPKL